VIPNECENIKCYFQWWEKLESMFPIVDFLTRQILGNLLNHKLRYNGFFLVKIFINLRRCCLQSHNFKKFIFVTMNWPSDLKVGCKSSSSLIKFIKMDVDLEKELEKFESVLERNDIVEL
jgi:hypothetical protein